VIHEIIFRRAGPELFHVTEILLGGHFARSVIKTSDGFRKMADLIDSGYGYEIIPDPFVCQIRFTKKLDEVLFNKGE
jgi:hypothetical protein